MINKCLILSRTAIGRRGNLCADLSPVVIEGPRGLDKRVERQDDGSRTDLNSTMHCTSLLPNKRERIMYTCACVQRCNLLVRIVRSEITSQDIWLSSDVAHDAR